MDWSVEPRILRGVVRAWPKERSGRAPPPENNALHGVAGRAGGGTVRLQRSMSA